MRPADRAPIVCTHGIPHSPSDSISLAPFPFSFSPPPDLLDSCFLSLSLSFTLLSVFPLSPYSSPHPTLFHPPFCSLPVSNSCFLTPFPLPSPSPISLSSFLLSLPSSLCLLVFPLPDRPRYKPFSSPASPITCRRHTPLSFSPCPLRLASLLLSSPFSLFLHLFHPFSPIFTFSS